MRRRPPTAVAGIDRVARALLRHRDAVLRPEPRLGAGARRHRPGHHLRRDGRHQHGARRADDARRLHDLRRAAADAEPHRRVDPRGHSRGVPRRRRSSACSSSAAIIRFLYGRPLETLLATFGVSLVLQQPCGRSSRRNNRSVETPAWMSGTLQINDALAHHLQPALHRDLHARSCSRILLVVLQAHAARPRHPRRVAEPRDGAGDGHPQRRGWTR